MRPILKASEMAEADRQTTERYGIPSILLMENAATAVTIAAENALGGVSGKRVAVVCGKGNNGGDGAAAARQLWMRGADVRVFLFGKADEASGDARTNFVIAKSLSGSRGTAGGSLELAEVEADENWLEAIVSEIASSDLVIDAVFGTGLSRPVEGHLGALIGRIEGQKGGRPLVLSVDLPSGLDADSSEIIGSHVTADITVTFTAPKPANVLLPVSTFNGDLITAEIGTPSDLVKECGSDVWLSELNDARDWLLKTGYSDISYKKSRGTLLLVAGSEKYSGAAVLAANGAMESGAGMVTLAAPGSALRAMRERLHPEVITVSVAETGSGGISEEALAEVKDLAAGMDAVGIGCGLGSEDAGTRTFVQRLVGERQVPFVVDADGLNALSPFENSEGPDIPLIVTPHQGEFLRMLGKSDPSTLDDRISAVRDFSVRFSTITVLKGARTLIGGPSGRVAVIATGNSGLGKAGNGDNLTGILSGFMAQARRLGMPMFQTAVAAVHLAGLAGDIARGEFGRRSMLASDVRRAFPEAVKAVIGSTR